jgi:hypothetical protein
VGERAAGLAEDRSIVEDHRLISAHVMSALSIPHLFRSLPPAVRGLPHDGVTYSIRRGVARGEHFSR